MAFNGCFKTEKNVAAKVNGWLWLATKIGKIADNVHHPTLILARKYQRSAVGDQNIYCHQDAAPEPVADGTIKKVIFDDAEVEYCGGPGFVKYFTSAAGFFTVDQDLGESEDFWTIYYNAKYTVKTAGYSPFIRFYFYKRSAANVDTLLWRSAKFPIGLLYDFAGFVRVVWPSGSVTVNDRLRIGVYLSEEIPA